MSLFDVSKSFMSDKSDHQEMKYIVFALWEIVYHVYEACQVTATIMILNFRTDRHGQTVQTQIRLLLKEQSDQGLHCSQIVN